MTEQETKPQRPHDTWVEGTRWRVVKDGARLSGMQSKPGYMQGWGQILQVGDVIECIGIRRGWGSDPISEAMFTSEASREARASFVNFVPDQGMWKPYPREGYLELVEEDTDGQA